MSAAASSSPLRLAELVAAVSLATDLGTGQPMEHALRVCLLAVELGGQLGAGEEELRDVYYVALLRAMGCVADAHQVAARFGDELLANAQISLMDTAQPTDVLNLLLRHVGQGQPALRRARMIAEALAAGPGERNLIITAHCEVAEQLALRLGVRSTVARGITQVFERWDSKGSPAQLRGEAILPAARLVALARDAELFYRLDGVEGVTHIVGQRAGTLYDPAMAACFCQHARSLVRVLDAFFEIACPGLWRTLLDEQRDVPYRANAPELFGDLTMPPYQISPADLTEIRVPSLIVHGSKSHPMFRTIAGILAEHIPGAQFVELEGSGHVTYVERPTEFAATVGSFADHL